MIPYSRQTIDDEDVEAVVEVLRSDWLTQGPKVGEFERMICDLTGAEHAVSFSSGTAALHAAAHAASLGPGDMVHTSPLSFVASANAARYVGADVGFVDVEPDTLNLDPAQVPPDADALVAVHYAGLPVDLAALEHRPRVIIEDAAHAIGASTADGPVGNCARSDMCCFSFHPVKTITTGEGGAVTTNSHVFAERLRHFRHHGIEPRPEIGPWAYDIAELGFNYRLTDIQAALGTSQLRKLSWFVQRRNELASRYRALLRDHDDVVLPPEPTTGVIHAYHLFPIQVAQRRAVVEGLRSAGIGAQVHYVPTYQFSCYGRAVGEASPCPVAERVYGGLLSLPLFPGLTDDEQDFVVATLLGLL